MAIKNDDYRKEIDELKGQVKELSQQLKVAGQKAVDRAEDKGSRYLNDARDYYDKVSDKAQEQWHDLNDDLRQTGSKVDRYVKENPWKAAGLAAAAGVLVALLSGSSRRRD